MVRRSADEGRVIPGKIQPLFGVRHKRRDIFFDPFCPARASRVLRSTSRIEFIRCSTFSAPASSSRKYAAGNGSVVADCARRAASLVLAGKVKTVWQMNRIIKNH